MTKKYGLIGCGMMGAEHIRNIALLDGAEFAFVYDPVNELAHAAADLAGGARVAPTIDALVGEAGLDAIIIASPNHLHVDQIEQIARHRSLPILCEKPLYTSPDDEARLDVLARSYSAPIWVAMEYRYMPPVARLIAEAHSVTGGVKLLSMREHRFPFLEKVGNWNRFNRNTGGTFVEKCCHFFDLMRLIIGAEPIRVMASAGQVSNHRDERYGNETPDVWDSGYVIFDFENGARAMLELCMFADGSLWNEEISAVGPQGKIECRLPGPQRFWPTTSTPPHPQLTVSPRDVKNPVTTDVPIAPELIAAGDHHGSTFFQHERFLSVVNGQQQPEVSLDDGRIAVKMGLAAQRSAEEHCVVSLAPEPEFA